MFTITDVRRGTSGTSRDVPIFVQFYEKIRTVSQDEKEQKFPKNGRFGEKNMRVKRNERER